MLPGKDAVLKYPNLKVLESCLCLFPKSVIKKALNEPGVVFSNELIEFMERHDLV